MCTYGELGIYWDEHIYIYIDLLGLLVVGLSDCQCKSITYNDGFPNSHLCVLALQTPRLVPDFNRRRWRARSATDRQVRRSNKNQMSTAWLVSRDCYTLFIGGSCICRVLHGFCDFILYIYSLFYDRFTLYYTFYKEFHQTYRHLRPIFQSIFFVKLSNANAHIHAHALTPMRLWTCAHTIPCNPYEHLQKNS